MRDVNLKVTDVFANIVIFIVIIFIVIILGVNGA